MVNESLHSFSCFDPFQGNFDVRNGFSSCVFSWRLAELLREEEFFEAVFAEIGVEVFDIVIDLLIGFLGLRLIGFHQYLDNLFQELTLQLATISSDNFDTFVLYAKVEVCFLACDDSIEVIEFSSHVLLLHEQDQRFENTVNINLQIDVFLIDVFLQILCNLLYLEQLFLFIFIIQILWLDHQ